MRWAEIKTTVFEESVDLVANILIEEGCGGAAIAGPSVRASGGKEIVMTAYLPVDDRLEGRLQTIRERIRLLPETGTETGPVELTIKPIDEADWANAWRSFFKPVELGRILIKPSWEEVEPKQGQVVVEIDPGMAFGTGNHPTTRLCLLALQERINGGESVLDVGTGSGILALAAGKLGAGKITATESDPVAFQAAQKNFTRNQTGIHILRTESPLAAGDRFDIVVANITADVIIRLADELWEVIRPGGVLLVSGLIEERAQEVMSKLSEFGFKKVGESVQDEWVLLEARKPDAGECTAS